MTAGEKPRAMRAHTLHEDLLADLRGTTPTPTPRQGRRAAPRRAATAAAPAPAVELQVTPTRWTAPSVRAVPGGSGVLLTAGPIRLSLSLPGR
jgi:hypothetical protein